MEVDGLWERRLHYGPQQSSSTMHASNIYSGSGEDTWEYFPCPFCYTDIVIPFLCNHLQEEHCFDVKNAVCPVCAANPRMDMIGHFMVQHSHMLKRMKPQKINIWTDSFVTTKMESYESTSFHGLAATNWPRSTANDSCAPDPLLSPFICSITCSDQNSQEENSENDMPSTSQDQSSAPSTSNDVSEQDYEESIRRAEFAQQVLISTIF